MAFDRAQPGHDTDINDKQNPPGGKPFMDGKEITLMVEEFWRSFITVSANGNEQAAMQIVNRFQARIDAVAEALPEHQQQGFVDAVEAERERLFREYNANPGALRARLGIVPSTPVRRSRSNRMGLGELAVRTTVRATVWESVFALFRAFR